jgi:hypothetical protein
MIGDGTYVRPIMGASQPRAENTKLTASPRCSKVSRLGNGSIRFPVAQNRSVQIYLPVFKSREDYLDVMGAVDRDAHK